VTIQTIETGEQTAGPPPRVPDPAAAAPPSSGRPAKKRRRAVPRSYAVPAVITLLIISVVPFAYSVALSLTRSTLGRSFQSFTGVDNFIEALSSDAFAGSLWRTTLFAVGAAVLELGLALPIAYALYSRGRGFGALGAVILLPLVTPPIMVGVAWQVLLSPAGGGLTWLWDVLGVAPFEFFKEGNTAFLTLLLIEVWQWTPFAILFIYTALLAVDQSELEAAQLDGAGRFRIFFHILLPSIQVTMWTVFLFRLLGGYRTFDIAYVITGGGPGYSTTFSTFEIFRTALNGGFDTGIAAAQTLILAVVLGLVTLGVAVWRKRATKMED
jgi:multiple sugar transport system permease protein